MFKEFACKMFLHMTFDSDYIKYRLHLVLLLVATWSKIWILKTSWEYAGQHVANITSEDLSFQVVQMIIVFFKTLREFSISIVQSITGQYSFIVYH